MKGNKIIKIGIAIIHNNDKERNEKLFPNIEILKKKLEEKFEVQLIDVSWQPTIMEHTILRSIVRDMMYWKINREWINYRLLNNVPFFLDFLVFLKIICKKITKSNYRRTSFIETIVTDKHIRAWQILFDKNDFFLFFEDDAIFLDDSIERLKNLFDYILDLEQIHEKYLYVDLSGGCDINSLRIHNLELKRLNNMIFYKKPVTNTACCYLINKKTILHFYECLIHNPFLRLIGIDWMMNKMLIELDKKGIIYKSICIHTFPPIFKHGSSSGIFKPWER